MRGAVLLFLVALAGCGSRDEPEAKKAAGPASAAPAPTLIGTWRTQQPARFAGEGYRTETSDGRTTYQRDGRFDYSGRLTIFGDRLPAEGLPFDMTGQGTWSANNRILSERFTTVQIVPTAPNATLAKLGRDAAAEVVARPASEADIVRLDAGQLMLRDRRSGSVATFARE